MTMKKFGEGPTPNEALSLDDISKESIAAAWEGYQVKPEYKEFNKHDLIESFQKHESDQGSQQQSQ